MITRHYLLAVALAVSIHVAPTVALAQATTDVEREKAHVVSRLYQATYGAKERCRPSKEASLSLGKAINQFRLAFPELMRLVDHSPYLPPARDQFKKFLADPSAKVSDEDLVQECQGLESLLLQFVDAPEAKDEMNKYVLLLKK